MWRAEGREEVVDHCFGVFVGVGLEVLLVADVVEEGGEGEEEGVVGG